uniref:BTB domain-containing protein n=1 Tax=Anopheles atroparvus TaxID=41427 RepID=A0AAG5DX41_ANOAO
MDQQHYCLRWKYHRSNLQVMFSQLLGRGCFCDVTLACEGQTIRAHRVVLCACSTYFENLLTNCYSEEKDPIIIMHDVRYEDVKCLIEFMYKGEINVEHGALTSLLKTAEDLRIKGLAEVSWQEGYDDSFDYGASSNGRVSVTDGAASSSSSAAIIEMSNLHQNEPCEAFESVATVLSSTPSPAPDEKPRSFSPNNAGGCNGVCISNSQDGIHKNTYDSSSGRNTDRACSIQSSVVNSDNSSDNKLSLSARIVGNSRLQNQEMHHTPVPIRNLGFFRSAETPSPAPQSASGCTSISKHSSSNTLVSVKKKRGRPPLDKEYKTFQPLPKLAQIERTNFAPFDTNIGSVAIVPHGEDPTGVRDRFAEQFGAPSSVPPSMPLAGKRSVTPSSSDESFIQHAWETKITSKLTANRMSESVRPSAYDNFDEPTPGSLNESVLLTPTEQELWKDVVKMSDYLARGRRPQFWEEPFTRRVMDGINSKTLEMKKAAKILGVSYGTLYGRYRETYGCLKHPNKGSFMTAGTRMQDMWHTNSSNVNISDIVSRIQQDRIASSRAAELLSNSSSAILSYLDHQQEQTTHTNTPDGCLQLPRDGEQDQ